MKNSGKFHRESIKNSGGTPAHQVNLIGDILQAFILKLNVPVEEIQELAGKVRKKTVLKVMESFELSEEASSKVDYFWKNRK